MLDIPTVQANRQARRQQPVAASATQVPGATSLAAPPPVSAPPAAPTGPSMSANEYVASKMGGYDWRGRQDEMLKNYADYNTQAQTAANTAAEPTISWKSDTPGLMYNPGGGTDWMALTPDMYTDPTVAGLLQTGAGRASPAQGLFQAELGKIPPPVYDPAVSGGGPTAGGGSQHTLNSDVINRMWR